MIGSDLNRTTGIGSVFWILTDEVPKSDKASWHCIII